MIIFLGVFLPKLSFFTIFTMYFLLLWVVFSCGVGVFSVYFPIFLFVTIGVLSI